MLYLPFYWMHGHGCNARFRFCDNWYVIFNPFINHNNGIVPCIINVSSQPINGHFFCDCKTVKLTLQILRVELTEPAHFRQLSVFEHLVVISRKPIGQEELSNYVRSTKQNNLLENISLPIVLRCAESGFNPVF